MTRRTFRLRDGWTLEHRTPPEAMGRYGPVPYEVVLRGPVPSDPNEIQVGLSLSGDTARECHAKLREDLARHGFPRMHWGDPYEFTAAVVGTVPE